MLENKAFMCELEKNKHTQIFNVPSYKQMENYLRIIFIQLYEFRKIRLLLRYISTYRRDESKVNFS